jgi:GDPmannose 4,6-dehydratase
MKTSIITGVNGQDGSYLADLLLEKNYKVVGLIRRSSINNKQRIDHILHHPNFTLEEFDITDLSLCNRLLSSYKPDEIYNLAAQSHVGTSFKQPISTLEIDAVGVVNLLESIRSCSPSSKFFQAGTSEMFGKNYSLRSDNTKYQNENTPMTPQSPYGAAKLAAYHMIQIYRSSYNLYCCCGILFNHEGPRRGENFVTRKITKYIGSVVKNQNSEPLYLGNLTAHRDWGHAKDYVRGMYLMMQQPEPEDFVLSTGETHTVEEFVEKAFAMANLDYRKFVKIDPELFRPTEVDYMVGDSTKAITKLNWTREHSFDDLIKDMINNDI